MKRTLIFVILLAFGHFSFSEEKPRIRSVTLSERNYSLETNLKDKLKWEMADGTLRFVQSESGAYIRKENGEILHEWKSPLEVCGAVASENKTALLVRIMNDGGYYVEITRFVLEDKKWEVDSVMVGKHPKLKIRDRWVRELGAVSDDGSIAILHVGESDSDRSEERTSYKMFYGWQTWELNQSIMLGVGLKICNGNRDNQSSETTDFTAP